MKNKFLGKVSLVISILIIAAFIRFPAGDILASNSDKSHTKWNICHHTGSETNPYVKINVSNKSEGGHFDASGNPFHGGDKLIQEGENCPASTPKPSASPNVVLSAPCTNCGGTTVNVTNNNNNTNDNTNNNNVNVTSTAEANVKVPTVLPETGVGAVAAGGILGIGPLGYYLARVKRGKLIKEVEEESLAETAFGLVNLRSALKQDA